MNLLGISAYYHDSAAVLMRDGEILSAAQEERFTRIKHDAGFPKNAIDFCLRFGGITAKDLNYVIFYEKPLLKLDRLLETYLAFAPAGFPSFSRAIPLWIKRKMFISNDIRKQLGGKKFSGQLVFPEHHESHGASAFFPSPFEEAAVVTIDGVGEWTTASIGYGKGNRLSLLKELRFPHSVGLLYSAFTYFTGFKVNSGEYKLMGLAPYGKPVYADRIREKLVRIFEDGSIELNLRYFHFCQGLTMTNFAFADLFGGPPRPPESQITQREMDLAASIQAVTEEILLKIAREAKRLTGSENLCLAGGVALNCSANGKLLREGLFRRIWVQPAAGDAGGALGAALFTHYQLLGRERKCTGTDFQKGSFLGDSFTNDEIKRFLEGKNIRCRFLEDEKALLEHVASRIAAGKVVGWFQGRMEFGPRALGARSILGDARSEAMQHQMNLKIKFRESFRPFAPAVLEEEVGNYYDFSGESPYMLLVAPLADSRRYPLLEADRKRMTESEDLNVRLGVRRSELPAVTHIDYSARLQTVTPERNGRFYRLLLEFKKQTGCPVLINTSFNIRGEPIVRTPENAYNCFVHTGMDMLVLENYVIEKEDGEGSPDTAEKKDAYLKQFQLD